MREVFPLMLQKVHNNSPPTFQSLSAGSHVWAVTPTRQPLSQAVGIARPCCAMQNRLTTFPKHANLPPGNNDLSYRPPNDAEIANAFAYFRDKDSWFHQADPNTQLLADNKSPRPGEYVQTYDDVCGRLWTYPLAECSTCEEGLPNEGEDEDEIVSVNYDPKTEKFYHNTAACAPDKDPEDPERKLDYFRTIWAPDCYSQRESAPLYPGNLFLSPINRDAWLHVWTDGTHLLTCGSQVQPDECDTEEDRMRYTVPLSQSGTERGYEGDYAVEPDKSSEGSCDSETAYSEGADDRLFPWED